MTIFLILALCAALSFIYALVLRPWLKTKLWAQGFFSWVEPIEIALFKKSETILVGRLLWIGSTLVTFYDGIAAFARSLDLTPVTTRLLDFLHIPQDLRSITVTAFIAGIGLVMNWLRGRTTLPIEIVAVPEKVIAENPVVAATVADAVSTNTVAIAAIDEAKAA